jgi:hypothetical protein
MRDQVRAEYTPWFLDELDELPPDQQARVVRRVQMLERKGWTISVRDDDIKSLDGMIWELRVIGKGPAYRVLFAPLPGKNGRIALLTNCVSKGLMKKNGVKLAEIERALGRRGEWIKSSGGER